jgi:N-acetylmuramoyl-L-alanine amidase
MTLTAMFALSASATICIDPGHPSEVGRGTSGVKLTEIEAAWQVGTSLAAELKARGYRVVLTKSSRDQMVKNRKRAEVANVARADLMVRLHCDAASGTGFTVYCPTQKGKSEGFIGPSQTVIEESAAAAKLFHRAMAARLAGKLKDNGLKSDLKTAVGARQGALTGSIFSRVPVILVEMVVLTNRKDEIFIASSTGRASMVSALVAGVQAAVPARRRE